MLLVSFVWLLPLISIKPIQDDFVLSLLRIFSPEIVNVHSKISTQSESTNILRNHLLIGGFRNSLCDVIFAHAHIAGRQYNGQHNDQAYGIHVKM